MIIKRNEPLIIFLEDEFANRVKKGANKDLISYKNIIKGIESDRERYEYEFNISPILENTPYMFNPYRQTYTKMHDNIDFELLQDKMRCIASSLRYMGATEIDINVNHIKKTKQKSHASGTASSIISSGEVSLDKNKEMELKQLLKIHSTNNSPKSLRPEILRQYIEKHQLDKDQLIKDKFFEYQNEILGGKYTETLQMESNLSSILEIGANLALNNGFKAKCNFSFSEQFFFQINYTITVHFMNQEQTYEITP